MDVVGDVVEDGVEKVPEHVDELVDEVAWDSEVVVDGVWPQASPLSASWHDIFRLCVYAHVRVMDSGLPNFQRCRIPIPSDLNVPLFWSLGNDYSDQQIFDIM